jgi:hypothetical protein
MKNCSTCKVKKEVFEFHKNVRSKDGFCNRCKDCDKAYKRSDAVKLARRKRHIKDKDKLNADRREYVRANRDRFNGYQKSYADKNRDKIRELNRKSYNSEKARPRNNARSASRRANRGMATLPGHKSQIVEIYKGCPEGFHVDHIVPLKGENVCGLHVPWNLQYLPALENIKKSNKVILKKEEV